ncbi:MAG: hypothetical protein RLZ10_2541, partial [Bacteroidota bacterium]
MPNLKEIFEQFVETIVPEIQSVSKRFAPTIESKITEKDTGITFEILGSPYIETLIDGRKPTSPNAPKGSPTLQQILLQWIKDKGIIPMPTDKGNIPTLEQLSWAMSNSMHKKGDLLWQRGGGNNIFEPI